MNQQSRGDGWGRSYEVSVDRYCLPLQMQFGLPRPDWNKFRADISGQLDEAALYRLSYRVWVQELATALGEPYRMYADDCVVLLSAQNAETTASVMRQCRWIRQEIARLLKGAVDFDLTYTDIVLIFNRGDKYASYVARYYDDGDFAGSGGMCVKSEGTIHIAMPWNRWNWHATLAHEFTHVALSGMSLPLWLEEGLVALVEHELAPRDLALDKLAPQELRQTRRFWKSHPLTTFWSGDAFSDVEAQEHAYRLADVLVRNLSGQFKARFREFVRLAHWEDAGAAAAQSVLGMSLQQCAGQFLGEETGS